MKNPRRPIPAAQTAGPMYGVPIYDNNQKIESSTPNEWRWKSKHIKLIDGSTLSMPETHKNQEICCRWFIELSLRSIKGTNAITAISEGCVMHDFFTF
jgi:hypothetical protein